MNLCPACLKEQERQIDAINGIFPDAPLPCPKHGDPSQLLPDNEDAFLIWQEIVTHQNFLMTAEMAGGQAVEIKHLDLSLIMKLCESLGVDFWATLEKLEHIYKEVVGV
jgi:hypothetical protein